MKYRYQVGETVYEVLLERHGDRYRLTVDGHTFDVEVLDAQPGALSLRMERPDSVIRPQVVYWGAEGSVKWFSAGGCTYRLDRPQERRRGSVGAGAQDDLLRAPMPALVRAVQVAEGDAVEAGQTLLLLEAMKMEIKLTSPRAGRVVRLLAKQGETVERDQILLELS